MTDYRIVEARPWHIGALVTRMESAELCWWFERGIEPRKLLRRVMREAMQCRTVMLGDAVVAMWGVSGSLLSPTSGVWLVLTPVARARSFAVVREVKAELRELLKTKASIETFVDGADRRAVRWLEFIGFVLDGPDNDGFRRGVMRAA